jgi:hypothetical protein
VTDPVSDAACPPWHWLPGPYTDDPEVQRCPLKDTHRAQRLARLALLDGSGAEETGRGD